MPELWVGKLRLRPLLRWRPWTLDDLNPSRKKLFRRLPTVHHEPFSRTDHRGTLTQLCVTHKKRASAARCCAPFEQKMARRPYTDHTHHTISDQRHRPSLTTPPSTQGVAVNALLRKECTHPMLSGQRGKTKFAVSVTESWDDQSCTASFPAASWHAELLA